MKLGRTCTASAMTSWPPISWTPGGCVTVIDAGLPGHWKELLAELEVMGRSTADVRGLSSSTGTATTLASRSGCGANTARRSLCTANAERARGGDKPKVSMGQARRRPVAGFLLYSLGERGWRTSYFGEVTAVNDGDVLPLPGAPRIIGRDTHRAASLCTCRRAMPSLWVMPSLRGTC
ncbi:MULTISPECIES: hypothetical protein [unclassified Arthrobacter]|nr:MULTISPECIES: hypothetical protein [unclassified Arthrobacter]